MKKKYLIHAASKLLMLAWIITIVLVSWMCYDRDVVHGTYVVCAGQKGNPYVLKIQQRIFRVARFLNETIVTSPEGIDLSHGD